MAEYIDREAAIKAIYESDPFGVHKYFGWRAIDIEEALRAIPAADVAPVRHGKWMPFHAEFAGDIQYCSVCEIGFADRTSFCPHCGAVMDGWRVEGKEND